MIKTETGHEITSPNMIKGSMYHDCRTQNTPYASSYFVLIYNVSIYKMNHDLILIQIHIIINNNNLAT